MQLSFIKVTLDAQDLFFQKLFCIAFAYLITNSWQFKLIERNKLFLKCNSVINYRITNQIKILNYFEIVTIDPSDINKDPRGLMTNIPGAVSKYHTPIIWNTLERLTVTRGSMIMEFQSVGGNVDQRPPVDSIECLYGDTWINGER